MARARGHRVIKSAVTEPLPARKKTSRRVDVGVRGRERRVTMQNECFVGLGPNVRKYRACLFERTPREGTNAQRTSPRPKRAVNGAAGILRPVDDDDEVRGSENEDGSVAGAWVTPGPRRTGASLSRLLQSTGRQGDGRRVRGQPWGWLGLALFDGAAALVGALLAEKVERGAGDRPYDDGEREHRRIPGTSHFWSAPEPRDGFWERTDLRILEDMSPPDLAELTILGTVRRRV